MTLEKPADAQLTTKIPHFTQMEIHYHIHAEPPLTPVLSKHASSLHPPIKIHLHISLPSIYNYIFQMVSFASGFPTKTLYAVFLSRHIICPAHLILITFCEKYKDNISISNLSM